MLNLLIEESRLKTMNQCSADPLNAVALAHGLIVSDLGQSKRAHKFPEAGWLPQTHAIRGNL
jgi:hypothetical protein